MPPSQESEDVQTSLASLKLASKVQRITYIL